MMVVLRACDGCSNSVAKTNLSFPQFLFIVGSYSFWRSQIIPFTARSLFWLLNRVRQGFVLSVFMAVGDYLLAPNGAKTGRESTSAPFPTNLMHLSSIFWLPATEFCFLSLTSAVIEGTNPGLLMTASKNRLLKSRQFMTVHIERATSFSEAFEWSLFLSFWTAISV